MDESWRMRMGMPSLHRQRSTEEASSGHRRNLFVGGDASAEALDADYFADVFGGPPRSVLSRKFSEDFLGRTRSRSTSFYEEIFRPPNNFAPANSGRSLPAFKIPASRDRNRGFYSDIFGSDDDRRLRSRSKVNSKSTNSSSVLSSEELSPLRPVGGDDLAFASFASKLRPINVPCRWSSSMMMPDEYLKCQGTPTFPCSRPSYVEDQYVESDYSEYFGSSHFGFPQRVSSPEIISLKPNSYGSVKVSADDLELNSPSSVVSSLCQDAEAKARVQDRVLQDEEVEEDDDEVLSSYVIEISSDQREGTGEADAIDEAIAWAKEKFQTQTPEKEWSTRHQENGQFSESEDRPDVHEFSDGQIDDPGLMQSLMEKQSKNWITENQRQMDKNMELELLDEDIKHWSADKEANIRLLLSTLHNILWPNSGWYAVPLTNLLETSQVKKAYQKARLCLHPDKLQQRGATLPQKYVAEKVFSILQDAWAAFITQDAFFS